MARLEESKEKRGGNKPVNKKIEIPSDIGYIKKVSMEIIGRLESLGVEKAVQFDIRLAVEEALRNAIEHGNRFERDIPVKISYEIDDNAFRIEVEDQGKGFNAAKIPDPRKKENLVKEGGRGVLLIRKLMDKVEYRGKGNKVSIVKYLK